MSKGKDFARGRRGGGWLDDGRTDIDLTRRCAVCDQPLAAGQTGRHTSCTPIDQEPAGLFDTA